MAGGREGVVTHDDFIAGLNPQGQLGEVQARTAVARRDGVANAADLGEPPLKFGAGGASTREPTRIKDGPYGRQLLVPNSGLAEGDGLGRGHASPG